MSNIKGFIKKSLLIILILISFFLGSKNFKEKKKFYNESSAQASLSESLPKDLEDNKLRAGSNSEDFLVTKVIDGDTIVVDIDGQKEKVRLIGVDTPETVDPRKKVQCFGKEASSFLKNLLTDRKVSLKNDSSQNDRDKYGRLLRYVYLDNLLVNKEIIEKGFGYEYTYKIPYEFQSDFKKAQKSAEKLKAGLWADGACVQ